MHESTFKYIIFIATTPEKLWEALTNGSQTEKYFFGSKIESDWRIGSKVSFFRNGVVTDFGEIIECEPFKRLSYTWITVGDNTPREHPTRAIFELHPMESTVKLIVKHEDLLEADYSDADDTFEGVNNGWPAILSNLKSLLETGKTLPPILV